MAETKLPSPREMQQLKKDLTDFLCLKYQYSDSDLEKRVEDPIWKDKFQNWEAIRSILTYKEVP